MPKSLFTDEYRVLIDALAKARRVSGLTQTGLAARLGKPQSFVSKYERGERRLDVIEFLTVARALGQDPFRLLQSVDVGSEGAGIGGGKKL